jgi:hypothetical protein
MTKTEAQDIITKAIAAEGPIAGTLSIDAFAQRIATALDALGMLQYADVADQPAPIEPTGAKAPAAEQPPTAQPAHHAWAQTRQRT